MEVKSTMLYATYLLLGLLIVASSTASAFMIAPQGYQSDQAPIVYKMPRRHSTKFKVFAECRRDCAGKCNHSLYAYLANKRKSQLVKEEEKEEKKESVGCMARNFRHNRKSWGGQRYWGIREGQSNPNLVNECFTCLLECMSVFTEQAEKMGIRVDFDKSKRRARRVTEFSLPVSTDSKKTVRNPLRGYMRSAQK
ncbi:hypothetical protein ACTXT7_002937 [Hymenolepis weldensis]